VVLFGGGPSPASEKKWEAETTAQKGENLELHFQGILKGGEKPSHIRNRTFLPNFKSNLIIERKVILRGGKLFSGKEKGTFSLL